MRRGSLLLQAQRATRLGMMPGSASPRSRIRAGCTNCMMGRWMEPCVSGAGALMGSTPTVQGLQVLRLLYHPHLFLLAELPGLHTHTWGLMLG